MENQSLTPKEIELHDKLKKVGEIILWYFRTRESERTYLSLTHGRGSKSWMWLNLCAHNAAKFTINYVSLPISHDMKFSIIYGNDTILSGQMFVHNGVLSLYWNNWWRFVSIALNENAGECAPAFNDKPIYPDLVDQKDLLAILKLISTNLGVAIVTAVQKKPEEPEELKEIAKEHDKAVLSEFCATLKEESLKAMNDALEAFKSKDLVVAPSSLGLFDPVTKDFDSVGIIIYNAFKKAIEHINVEYDVEPKHIPHLLQKKDEYMFAFENSDGHICAACSKVDEQYELWYRDTKGIKHVFMRINVRSNGWITTFDGDPHAVTLLSARIKKFIRDAVKEHNELSEFCNTLKEFSEEYADSWLINKFNKLISVLKTYCSEINQLYRHEIYNDTISWGRYYMSNHNLLPPVTMTGDRYHYDYNPTTFKIFDMYDSNGDLMVKVDHETFEINFYFYHSATEPFLTISAIDYMGHVKQTYCDSHGHMDEFKFKYLIERIEKELKIQIMYPFADPVIIDDTWKDTDLVSEIIEGSSVVNDTWKNPDLINTTNFKGVKKMTFAKLRTIVLSWISQNIMGNNILSTVTTSHDIPGVPIKITVTEWATEMNLFINFNNDQTEFSIYEGIVAFPNRAIIIKSDENTNSHSVEFNNYCKFSHFSRERMLSLYNTICTEMGKESNATSICTTGSATNIVNRYGNMSPRYEVKDAFDMADGSKVVTGLKLLSMNIVKSSDGDFTGVSPHILPRIKSILFNEKKKVTTIIWNDNTKTMAKCTSDDDYDEEIGVAICIAKKYYGNNQNQMRKEINKFKTRQKKHEDAVQKRLDKKKNKSTEIIDNKPNEVKVDDNTDNIIG